MWRPSTILVSMLMLMFAVATLGVVGNPTTADAARHDRKARAEISHGSDVPDGTYPFVVALGTVSESGGLDFFYCGASLIAPSYVLTAAHCVLGVTPDEVAVLVGPTEFGTNQGEQRRVAAIAMHPAYDSRTGANDVAVLTLTEPSSFLPVAVVGANDDSFNTPGTSLTIVGWGDTVGGKNPKRPANRLQQATVSIIADEPCAKKWKSGTGKNYIQGPITLCTTQGHLPGDSGGPFFTVAGGTYLQISVITSAYGKKKPHKVADFGPQLSDPGIRDFIGSIAGV